MVEHENLQFSIIGEILERVDRTENLLGRMQPELAQRAVGDTFVGTENQQVANTLKEISVLSLQMASNIQTFLEGGDIEASSLEMRTTLLENQNKPPLEDEHLPGTKRVKPKKESSNENNKDDKAWITHPGDLAMKAVLDKYRSHPEVQKALHDQRKLLTFEHRASVNILDAYMTELRTYGKLPAEEQMELLKQIQHGFKVYDTLDSLDNLTEEQESELIKLASAYEILMHKNQGLVAKFARWFYKGDGVGLSMIELIQEGNIGLSRAIVRHDPEKKATFGTYAPHWIKQAVRVAIANQTRTIRVPVNIHNKYLTAVGSVAEKKKQLGRELTAKEIQIATGMSMEKFEKLMQWGSYTIPSLDAAVDSESDTQLGDFIGDLSSDMESDIHNISDQMEVKNMLDVSALTVIEKFILGMRYGLSIESVGDISIRVAGNEIVYSSVIDAEGMEFEKIAEIIGISRKEVEALHSRILMSLQRVAKVSD